MNKKSKVLVISAGPEQFSLAVSRLQFAGCSVLYADNSGNGLKLAQTERPGLIISELAMPNIDGLELCRQVRQDKKLSAIPILLVGDLSEKSSIVKDGLRCGASDYVVKRIDQSDLFRRCSSLIGLKGTDGPFDETEDVFRTLTENISDIITIIAADGTILFESPSAERALGFAPDELVGKQAFDYVHPDDLAGVIEYFKTAIRRFSTSPPIEYRFRHKNGSWRFIESIGKPFNDAQHGLVVVITSRDTTARKDAANAKRETDSRLSAIFENAAIGMALVNQSGHPVQSNPALQKMLGYTAEELQKMSFVEFTHPNDVEADVALVGELIDGKRESYQIEKRYITKACEVLWGRLTVSKIGDQSDESYLIAMVEDINDKKSARAALLESEDRVRAQYEGLPIPIFTWRKEGDDFNFDGYNLAAERLTYGNIAGSIGVKASVHFKDTPAVLDAFRKCVADQVNIGIAGKYCFKSSGESKYLDANIVFIKPDIVMVACRDITEQTETERLLKESRERFELVSVATNDGLWDWDFITNSLWLNEEFYNLLGMRPGDVEPTKDIWYAAIHPDDRERVKKSASDAIAAGVKYWADEYRMVSKSGSVLFILDRSYVVYDAEGTPVRMIGAVMDVTDLRRTETALVKSEQHFALAQQAARIGTFEFDLRTSKAISSPELETLYGVSPGSLNRSFDEWVEHIHPEDSSYVTREIARASYTGEHESEFRIVRGDGEVRWMYCKGKVFYEPDGQASRLVGVNMDITERKLAEQDLQTGRVRLYRQNKVLNELNMHHKLFGESLEDGIRETLEISARTLDVEQVSVWLYSDDRSKLRAVDLYEKTLNCHSAGLELAASDFPVFFGKIWEDAALAVEDLSADPRTAELAGSISPAEGMTSLLTAPIRLGGEVVGLICHGHAGEPREWMLDEQNFAASMADMISLLVEGNKRRVAENAASYHKELYKLLIDSIEGIVWESGAGNLTCSFVSRQAERLLGYPVASWTDQPRFWSEHIHPDDRERVVKFCEAAVSRGENHEIDYRMVAKDGRVVWLHDIITIDARDKDDVRMRGVMVDITQSKQAEAALAEANERAISEYIRLLERLANLGQRLGAARELKSVFEAVVEFATNSVPCSAIVISLYDKENSTRDAVYIWYNGTEMDPAELQKVPVGTGVVGRAIQTGEIIVIDDYLGRTIKQPTVIYKGYDEDPRDPQSAVVAPMKTMGEVIGVVEVQSYELAAYTQEHATAIRMAANLIANAIENVRLYEAEQMRAEQLRQSQRLESVGRLAGGIAHDFNNMLTAINGFSDLTLRKLEDSDPLRNNLVEIRKAGGRSAELTQQLLAFSRRQVLRPKVIDINQTVAETTGMLDRLIGEDVELVLALAADIGSVEADPGQLSQVIMNLAVNSRDAMPNGGTITIETSNQYLDDEYAARHVCMKPGSYVVLAVSDTGVGMSAEVQEHLFEPFFTTKEQGKGTGLGLATTYGIVKQSGGYIWAYSEVDQGAVVKVYLPRVDAKVEDLKAENITAGDLRGSETILLVEDEDLVRELSKKILENCGYKVVEATDGTEALALCMRPEHRFDLLVTDVVMPKMSGRQLVQNLETVRPDLKVLFMSGYTDDSIVRHGVIESGQHFIQKPFTFNAFAGKVREMLDVSKN